MERCRVEDETTAHNESEAQKEEAQICDECSDQFPATEFKYPGICKGCAEWGHCPDEHTFISETGRHFKT
jgi:hypothetical protein